MKEKLQLLERRLPKLLVGMIDLFSLGINQIKHVFAKNSSEKLVEGKTHIGEVITNNFLFEHDENDERLLLPVKATEKAVFGDVICVRRLRDLVEHYGVYIGKGRVIHYTPSSGEIGFDLAIRETSIEEFLNEAKEYYICLFPEDYAQNYRESSEQSALSEEEFNRRKSILDKFRKNNLWFEDESYCLFGPEETVARAKERLGESAYSLLHNNCEHFALWCKTNISESYQINKLIRDIQQLPFISGESKD